MPAHYVAGLEKHLKSNVKPTSQDAPDVIFDVMDALAQELVFYRDYLYLPLMALRRGHSKPRPDHPTFNRRSPLQLRCDHLLSIA